MTGRQEMSTRNPGKQSLGRGLATLLGDLNIGQAIAGEVTEGVTMAARSLPIERIRPNPLQPRREFSEEELRQLSESIEQHGFIQPIVVRPDPEEADSWMLVAGERRWRAAQLARRHEVPAIVKDITDREGLEIAIIENVQRSDLNAIEEASAFKQLMDHFGHTQERLALTLGKSRSSIANMLRILRLPDTVQQLVRAGTLSAGHARALLASADPEEHAAIVVRDNLSVRETEHLVKRHASKGRQGSGPRMRKDANTRVLEATLSAAVRAKVSISVSRSGDSGKLSVGFESLEQLEGLCRLLQRAGQERQD